MKYLTGISQGFNKCTKAILQNNYFCRMPPDDCFCLIARYHYNKKRQKFKTVFICRSSRKLLILHYLWKKFFKFSNAQKKFSMLLLFDFVPQQILNFRFIFHFMKLIASEFDNESSSKSVYFSRDSLCFIYFKS